MDLTDMRPITNTETEYRIYFLTIKCQSYHITVEQRRREYVLCCSVSQGVVFSGVCVCVCVYAHVQACIGIKSIYHLEI